MSDEIINARLEDIAGHIGKIKDYFIGIEKPEDFLTKEGIKTFDAISMRLQVVGESLKKIEGSEVFQRYPLIDWNEIIKLRDLISHHYDKLEYEIIFFICQDSIPELDQAIKHILKEIK